MENYFEKFRKNIVGNDLVFKSPYGEKKMIYADWLASGRLYRPIEEKLMNELGPYVGNTHTETSETGTLMTKSYHLAHRMIKEHVNASRDDLIITAGFGMTTVVNKLQRMLGLRACGKLRNESCINEKEKPVVFITHMEHHSNHTSWIETVADVVQLQPGEGLLVDPEELRRNLEEYKEREVKIGSFTACSNVTGIITPYHELAKIMHEYRGVCFVDFAASAPYCEINMHPDDPMEKLDAIFFSPHKFLGGPGGSGVLVFNSSIYNNYSTPDNPGGGTVDWTNPWGEFKYIDDIEAREDGGTPGFLQAIKIALAIELKNQMGVEKMRQREDQLVKIAFREMRKIPNLKILADNIEDRLGVISFYIKGIHYNLVVKLLNDRFGVQGRGGCACAGTYGHFLLDVSHEQSKEITDKITIGDLSEKPGWIRLSIHPTMTNEDLYFIIDAIKQISGHHKEWERDYIYNKHDNEFRHKAEPEDQTVKVLDWFKL